MWRVAGAIGGAAAGLAIWTLMRLASQGLPQRSQVLVIWPAVGVAALIGFLAGGAMARRARSARAQIGLFSTLTGAVAGGIIGLATVLAVTSAYLVTYSSWPDTLSDQILMVLAFPAFGIAGGFIGIVVGSICGAAAGAILRLLPPEAR